MGELRRHVHATATRRAPRRRGISGSATSSRCAIRITASAAASSGTCARSASSRTAVTAAFPVTARASSRSCPALRERFELVSAASANIHDYLEPSGLGAHERPRANQRGRAAGDGGRRRRDEPVDGHDSVRGRRRRLCRPCRSAWEAICTTCRVGMSALGWAGDQVEPGVSIANADGPERTRR